MPIGTARVSHHQMLHYFRKRVNYNDAGIAAGVNIGTLPAGAMIVSAHVRVNTAFNGASATLNVGTTALGGEIIPTATTAPATAGYKTGTAAAGALTFLTDTDVFVSVGGTVGTAGQADLVLAYAPNNDQ